MLLGAKPSPTQASLEHRIQSCGPTAEVPGALVLRAGSEPDKPARVKLTIARKPAATIPRAQLETITNALHLPNGLTVRQGKSPFFISARTGLELINSLRMGVQIFPR